MRLALLLFSLALLSGCTALTQDRALRPEPGYSPALRGSAIIEFRDSSVLRGHAVIVAKKPASFRIELRGPLGHTAWGMTGNGSTISVYSNGKSRAYSPDDPALPYRFTSHELVSYLFGLEPETTKPLAETAEYAISRDSDGQVTEALKYIEERAVLSVQMGDYRTISGRKLPFLISIRDLNRSLKINFSTIEVDPEINDAIFKEFFKNNEVTD